MNKKYNIGLDIGTSSVGWACVEENTQKLIKKGTKTLWGVRLFDQASTAAERRESRGSRRRYDRRRNRIKLLQAEFNNEIKKVDKDFFTKLKESKYHEDDINNKTIILHKAEKKRIKEYNEKYKTIYHLRKKLIENPEKEDIRLVYLAIHHIIKYRGNFLYGNSTFNVNNLNIEEKLINVFECLYNLSSNLEIPENYSEILNINKIANILLNKSKNDIKVEIKNELADSINKQFATEFGKMAAGNKFSIDKLLSIEDPINKTILSFNGSDYDDKYSEFEESLGDKIEILDSLKELYDSIFLRKLFNGNNNKSLSSLMVDKYIQHKKDLRLLKNLFSKNRRLYNILLRNTKDICIYNKYINNKISNEEFIKELNKLLEQLFSNSQVEIKQEYIDEYNLEAKNRIVNGEFLPRITNSDNGKYPYQLNKEELIKIIENQGKYYPFLLEKTADDTYRIVKLLEFKIPYYIGPLVSEEQSPFAWLERKKDNIKITPYNFDEVVDKEKTAEKFIKRMISRCTYLLEEPALPNNSILYCKYKVMNELKQIKVNGENLTNNQQHRILEDLFMKTKGSITNKKFVDYLKSCNDMNMYDELNVSGYSSDNKFANSMQTYYDFFEKDGIFAETTYKEDDAEQIIEWITIFEDKDILESKIRAKYIELSNAQIKKILNKKYKGWGNLSRKLLNTRYYKDKQTGIFKSIMDLLYETNENFMQIINNDEYKFQNMIKEYNKIDNKKTLNYDLISNLTTSKATKRGIYQALKVVDEIINYIGYNPKNIIIEMSRNDDKKARKDDRNKYLITMYKSQKNDIDNYQKLMSELNEYIINNQKLFLYFIQEGKCLYSRKPLNIEDLDSYEIDHIIPRILIKDDSIDNKALVYSECNQNKAASYVLPREYRNEENVHWWKKLKKIGFISAKKYHNLIRNEYKEEDIQGFINRQLVETRQITKHVANLLSNLYKNTNVIYLKSTLSHNYRERYELFKFRELNDYHHAHDAYLAAVLGEYKEKYMHKKINFEMIKRLNSQLIKSKEYKKLNYGFVINSLDETVSYIVNKIFKNLIDEETKTIVFDAKKFNEEIEKTLYRNDILVSKKTEIRSGQLFKQTIYNKEKGNIQIKKNMPVEKYGGYSNIETSYLCLVQYKNKIKLIGIPMDIALKSKKDNSIKNNFIKEHLKLKDYEKFILLKDKVSYETEFIYRNQNVYIKGYSIKRKTCELSNAYQLKIPKENMKQWKRAFAYILNTNKNYITEAEKYSDEIIEYLLSQENKYPLFKNEIIKIKNIIDYKQIEQAKRYKLIKELLSLYHCNSVNANLSDFKLKDRIGRLSGYNVDKGRIIYKSVTGIKEESYEF